MENNKTAWMDLSFLPTRERPRAMTQCPKCGGSRISAPKYQSAEDQLRSLEFSGTFGKISDHLVYTCQHCGYQKTQPCLDARGPADAE